MVVLAEERPGDDVPAGAAVEEPAAAAAAVRDADRLAAGRARRVAARLPRGGRDAPARARSRGGVPAAAAGAHLRGRCALDDPEVIERAATEALIEPAGDPDVAHGPGGRAGAAGRHGGLALAVARLARAGLQARRARRGAALHVPVLRADPRHRAARGLADREPRRPARLPPGRGLRGGDRQPRAGAHPPSRIPTPSSRC